MTFAEWWDRPDSYLAYDSVRSVASRAFNAGCIAEREECALTVETESQDSTRYDFAQAIRSRSTK